MPCGGIFSSGLANIKIVTWRAHEVRVTRDLPLRLLPGRARGNQGHLQTLDDDTLHGRGWIGKMIAGKKVGSTALYLSAPSSLSIPDFDGSPGKRWILVPLPDVTVSGYRHHDGTISGGISGREASQCLRQSVV